MSGLIEKEDRDEEVAHSAESIAYSEGKTIEVSTTSATFEAVIKFFQTNKGNINNKSVSLSFRRVCPFALTDAKQQRLTNAIEEANIPISHLSFDPKCMDLISAETARNLYRALRSTESLKFHSTGWLKNQHRLRQLTDLRTFLENLKSLKCLFIKFCGDVEGFEHFAARIQAHRHLSKFEFWWCDVYQWSGDHWMQPTAKCINPVLAALGAVQNLQSLKLGCWTPSVVLQEGEIEEGVPSLRASLAKICHHPKLESLFLNHDAAPLNEHFLASTMASLNQSMSLQYLYLEIQSNEHECNLLSKLIRGNENLKFLHLHFIERTGQPAYSPQRFITELSKTLADSSTLTGLKIDCRDVGVECDCVRSNAVQNAILSVLETKNLTLKKLEFLPTYRGRKTATADFIFKMNLYLKLNEVGRKALLNNPMVSAGQWVQALSKTSDDAAALFYLLSKNPALCETSKKQKLPPKSQHEASSQAKRCRFHL